MWVLLNKTFSIRNYDPLKGSNLAPESVSMLRAAKKIVLQGCDVENTLEHTSVMAAKGVSSISVTYHAAGNFSMTNCTKKNWHAGNKYTLLPERRNFMVEVDSVCPNHRRPKLMLRNKRDW